MKTGTIIKTVVLGISLAFATNKVTAQETKPVKEGGTYSNAFGLRGGGTSGLTYKHRFYNHNAVEIIVGAFPYAFSVTGLYERYVPTGVNGLQCYFGGGGHVGNQFVNRYGYTAYREDGRYYYYRTNAYGPAIGGDGIMGIEYKIPRAPFAFSFDLKPYFEFVPGLGTYGNVDPGLGVKIAF